MKIIYWSQTGNTEKIAELISQGLRINETPEEDSKECLEFRKLIAKEAMGE